MIRPETDLAWMDAHVRVLFTRDAAGDLLRTNEPRGREAPRFWWGRTERGERWAFRADVPESTRSMILALRAEWPGSIRDALEIDAPIARAWRGPAFRFPRDLGAEVSPDLRTVEPPQAGSLVPHFADLVDEVVVRAPCLAVLVEGVAVSVASAARAEEGFVEAAVDTAEGHRGRGHATRVVAAWARAVREGGREPLYSTSWENWASRTVARKLGLVRYGEDVHFT